MIVSKLIVIICSLGIRWCALKIENIFNALPLPPFSTKWKYINTKYIVHFFITFCPTFISISMSLKSFSIGYILLNFLNFIYQQYCYQLYYSFVFCCFVEIKKYPCMPFFNCLFTFTMECGAYSNNAMSSRSSFTK